MNAATVHKMVERKRVITRYVLDVHGAPVIDPRTKKPKANWVSVEKYLSEENKMLKAKQREAYDAYMQAKKALLDAVERSAGRAFAAEEGYVLKAVIAPRTGEVCLIADAPAAAKEPKTDMDIVI